MEAEAEEMTNAEEMVEAQAAEADAENNAEAQATDCSAIVCGIQEQMTMREGEQMTMREAEQMVAYEEEQMTMREAEDSDFEACWADFFAMLRKAEDEGTLDEFFESIYQ